MDHATRLEVGVLGAFRGLGAVVLALVAGGCGGGGGGGGDSSGPTHTPVFLSGDVQTARVEDDGRVSMQGHGGQLGPLALTLAFAGAPEATVGYDSRGLAPLPDPYRLDAGLAKGEFTLTVAPEEVFGFAYNAPEEQIFLTARGGIHVLVDARALTGAPVLEGNVLHFTTSERGRFAAVVDRVAAFDGRQLLGYTPISDFSIDQDGDRIAAPLDCNDADPAISPLGNEIANDGVDGNCDGLDIPDDDHDGFASAAFAGGNDCNDQDANVNPGAEELVSDGVDNDCNGVQINDDDGDGVQRLIGGDDPGPDCNDGDASVFPGAPEVFGGNLDHNCNGVVPGNRLMGEGDSLTEGVGDPIFDDDPDHAGYLPRLADLLGIPNDRVANRGRGGTESIDGVRNIDRDLSAEDPDLVILLFGANDSLHEESVSEFISNMEEIVARIRGFGARVVLPSVTHVCCGRVGPPIPVRNEEIDNYNAALQRLADETGSVYVDVQGAFNAAGGTSNFLADGLHPNAAGYDIMAAEIANAITTRVY